MTWNLWRLLLGGIAFCLVSLGISVVLLPADNPQRDHEEAPNYFMRRTVCKPGFFFHPDHPASEAGCLPCPPGTFSFPGWLTCHRHLTCESLASGEVRLKRFLGSGAVKFVYLAEWQGLNIAFSVAVPNYLADFSHHLQMLERLGPNGHTVQLLGSCEGKYIMTQYSAFGDASHLDLVLVRLGFYGAKNFAVRTTLAIDFVASLAFLHDSPAGVRVMCDGNDVKKLLSQFIITDDFRLVVNDLDALPEVVTFSNGSRILVKCGHRQLEGELVAPEQKWPYSAKMAFNDSFMPGYDEKIDVWRVPDVTRALLGDGGSADEALKRLQPVHTQCKSEDPRQRPTAKEVLAIYKSVLQSLVVP